MFGDIDALLYGRDGDDKLYGNEGNDILNGGRGNDFYYGNDGADTFVLGQGDGTETIYDFEDGTDKIYLEYNLSFNQLEIVKMGSSTSIKAPGARRDDAALELAILPGIDPGLIDETDFV
ncbi:MAG: hypothetical protein EBE86_025860 [Hormoscilla sp. GUM202]|nr:hypothetical protein [Hormoscilla sp. GUM202]